MNPEGTALVLAAMSFQGSGENVPTLFSGVEKKNKMGSLRFTSKTAHIDQRLNQLINPYV